MLQPRIDGGSLAVDERGRWVGKVPPCVCDVGWESLLSLCARHRRPGRPDQLVSAVRSSMPSQIRLSVRDGDGEVMRSDLIEGARSWR
jgi:hypothetical protein